MIGTARRRGSVIGVVVLLLGRGGGGEVAASAITSAATATRFLQVGCGFEDLLHDVHGAEVCKQTKNHDYSTKVDNYQYLRSAGTVVYNDVFEC